MSASATETPLETAPPEAPEPWHQRLRHSGKFWMVVASLLFATMGMFVKLGSAYYSTGELVFYRCLIGFIAVGTVVVLGGGSLHSPVIGLHITRGVSGTVAMGLFFIAITHLPLGTAVTLNYTSPLFLALLTLFWLRQRVTWQTALAVVIGFSGVVLLLRPTFSQAMWGYGLAGLASGFLASVAYLSVRELSEAGETDARTVFYFSLIALLASGVWMLFGTVSPMSWKGAGILLGMGLCATAAQMAMTRAYRKGRPIVVVSFAYVTVLASSGYGIWFWDDRYPPTAWLAAALILASGVLSSRR